MDRPLDNLTVCVTAIGERGEQMREAVWSASRAGVRRVTISAMQGNARIAEEIEYLRTSLPWISFEANLTAGDAGCNESWMRAAYLARTKRILLLHDDDRLLPEFGEVYDSIIAPALDRRDAGFASWRPELRKETGETEPCDYWEGPSTLMPSPHLLKVVGQRGRLSLSPIVSVFNRRILIQACKEARETLRKNDSLERPGMLLGTEILVYARHIQAFKRWLYLDYVLSQYGAHEKSGTVKAQKEHRELELIRGYDLARDQAQAAPPTPRPKILLVYSAYEPENETDRRRQAMAQASWRWHADNGDLIELPQKADGLPRIRTLLDFGCSLALPEDVVVYLNADAGLTTAAPERILAGVDRGRGVTCCFTRKIEPEGGRLYKSVAHCKATLGIEAVAMTASWWALHREKMPDMYIGREAWDLCFATLAEEWADGRPLDDTKDLRDERLFSRAHTDDVIWHEDHYSAWQEDRTGSDTQKHNRRLAAEFFREHGCIRHLDSVSK